MLERDIPKAICHGAEAGAMQEMQDMVSAIIASELQGGPGEILGGISMEILRP